MAAGFGRKWIANRVKRNVLVPITQDVFLYGTRQPEPLSFPMSSLLQLRGDAVASGAWAVWLWGAFDEQPQCLDITLIGRSVPPRPGVVIHRVPELHPKDIRWRKGVPVTAPARSWLDFAASADPVALASGLAVIRREGLASDRQIHEAIERLPQKRPGLRLARELLGQEPAALAKAKWIYERKLVRLCAAAKLPTPETNVYIETYESDLVWRRERVIVEFDGWDTHKQKFRSDRSRDARLAARGWVVLRFTADRVDGEPYAVIAEIAATLGIASQRLAA
jgi:very-short-patch-repair endonuclease